VYSLLGGPTRLIYARDHRCVSVRIVADVVAAAVVYLITGWGNNKWVAHRIIESTDGRLRTTNELRAQDHFAIQSAKLSKHFPPVTLIERWPICWLTMTDDCGREFARCFASGPGKKNKTKKWFVGKGNERHLCKTNEKDERHIFVKKSFWLVFSSAPLRSVRFESFWLGSQTRRRSHLLLLPFLFCYAPVTFPHWNRFSFHFSVLVPVRVLHPGSDRSISPYHFPTPHCLFRQ